MIVRCEKCGAVYEDENWSTLCPHDSIFGGYCRKHDLFSCYICKGETQVNPLFEVHMLNEEGKANAKDIATKFDILLLDLEKVAGDPPGREFAIVKTKLEEACFFAKKAMANQKRNQA